MSLLEDLQNLDLSEILDARASISVTISTDDFDAMVSGGATVAALGDFGANLQQLREMLDNPAAFVQPLVDAVAPLAGQLEIDMELFQQYSTAIQGGAEVLANLLGSIDADPAMFGQAFGRSLGDAFGATAAMAEQYLPVRLDDLASLRDLIERVDSGVPVDPELFAELALDVLAPFSRGDLAQIRGHLDQLFNLTGGITVDATLAEPLVAAFDLVAAAGTEAELQAALDNLNTVRSQVLNAVQAQYSAIASAIADLPLDEALGVLTSLAAALRTGEQDILNYLETWRRDIARARAVVAGMDIAQMVGFITQMVDQFEAVARSEINQIFDQAIARLRDWVRGLLSHLRLQAIRNQIRAFILSIAQAIRDANLDVVATEARNLLVTIRTAIDSADLAESIQAALADIEQMINDALGGVISALQTIGNQVNAVAGEAQAILEQAATVLVEFQTTADSITAAVEDLGLEQATQQVIDKLVEVREAAEALLTVAPLPEPLREQVNQLIELVQSLDVDAIFDPVYEALSQFDIPDSVITNVTASLETLQEVVQNLIPAELIASIEAEVNDVLDVIRGFDPTSLLDGVTDFIGETADFIDGISVTEAATSIAAPFQEVLDAIDELHPERLLAPVIEAYDSLMGQIPTPSPATVVDRTVGAVGAAAETVTRTATQPARSFLPQTSGTASQELPPAEATVPGDFVRLLGYLPNKLREVLVDLEAGPAGEALDAIDRFTRGLARDLRRLQGEVAAIEARLDDGLDEMLGPLGAAQARSQLSIRANFSGGGVDVNNAMAITANAGPGALRAALADSVLAAREQAQQTALMAGGGVGLVLENAADALERSSIARLVGDLDAFLAALDPEPIADELDALVVAVMSRIPEAIDSVRDVFISTVQRLQALMEELNPGVQAQRFLEVLEVIQQELDALNPRRLAADLGEIHAAIRATIAAYDPRIFAAEIDAVLDEIAGSLRELSPENLLGDIDFLQDTVNLVENAVPTQALAGVGASLAEIGATLGELDIAALLDAIESLGPRVVEGFAAVVKAIQNELIALLESLRYASGSVSVSVEVSV